MSWMRLSGKVIFADCMDIKTAMFEKSKNLTFLFETPENPIFKAFYLEDAKAVLYQFNEDPIEYTF